MNKREAAEKTDARQRHAAMLADMHTKMTDLIQMRGALPREDLEYVVTKLDTLKDERFKQCVANLIGWGDDERAELETFVAVALEVLKDTTPSRLRAAAQTVHIRSLIKDQ